MRMYELLMRERKASAKRAATEREQQDRARFDRYVCALARLHPEKSIDTVVERAALLYNRANAKWEEMQSEAKGEQP